MRNGRPTDMIESINGRFGPTRRPIIISLEPKKAHAFYDLLPLNLKKEASRIQHQLLEII